MLNRTQTVCRNAEAEAAVKSFGKKRHILQVWQEYALGFVICVAHIVANLATLTGQFADAGHGVTRLKFVTVIREVAALAIPTRNVKSGPKNQAVLEERMTQSWPLPPPMERAFAAAEAAAQEGEVPIGAVIVHKGHILAVGRNAPRAKCDPTAHAEIIAIREAARILQNERLEECDLWVTLEPCPMCAGAISHARIRRLYYAASDEKGGAVEHGARVFEHPQALHRPEVYSGFGAERAAKLLRDFFRARRE